MQNVSPDDLSVRAGEWDTSTKNEPLPVVDGDVQDVIVHEKFYKDGLHNAIALLFLKEPFNAAQHIAPICLPPQDETFDASRCFATGWGRTTYGKTGKIPSILKKVEVPVVPFEKCQDALRTTILTEIFVLHESFMCAGGEEGIGTMVRELVVAVKAEFIFF